MSTYSVVANANSRRRSLPGQRTQAQFEAMRRLIAQSPRLLPVKDRLQRRLYELEFYEDRRTKVIVKGEKLQRQREAVRRASLVSTKIDYVEENRVAVRGSKGSYRRRQAAVLQSRGARNRDHEDAVFWASSGLRHRRMVKTLRDTPEVAEVIQLRDEAFAQAIHEGIYRRKQLNVRTWLLLVASVTRAKRLQRQLEEEKLRKLRGNLGYSLGVVMNFLRRARSIRAKYRASTVLIGWLSGLRQESVLKRFVTRLRWACRVVQQHWRSRAECKVAWRLKLQREWKQHEQVLHSKAILGTSQRNPEDMDTQSMRALIGLQNGIDPDKLQFALKGWQEKRVKEWIPCALEYERNVIWPNMVEILRQDPTNEFQGDRYRVRNHCRLLKSQGKLVKVWLEDGFYAKVAHTVALPPMLRKHLSEGEVADITASLFAKRAATAHLKAVAKFVTNASLAAERRNEDIIEGDGDERL